jgi:hypothetical protein
VVGLELVGSGNTSTNNKGRRLATRGQRYSELCVWIADRRVKTQRSGLSEAGPITGFHDVRERLRSSTRVAREV